MNNSTQTISTATILKEENTWVFDFPFQDVFVEAHVREAEVDPTKALQILYNHPHDYCRVRIEEGAQGSSEDAYLPEVTLGQLCAPCPFCSPEKELALQANRWLSVFEMPDCWVLKPENKESLTNADDIDSAEEYDDDKFWNTTEARTITDFVFNLRDTFRHLDYPENLEDVLGAERKNPYSLHLYKIRRNNPSQIRMVLNNDSAIHNYGLGSFLAGVYCCPNCGNAFNIAYMDPTIDDSFKLKTKAQRVITGYLRDCRPAQIPLDNLKVKIEKRPNEICILATFNGFTNVLAFEFETGLVRFDGVYVHREYFEPNIIPPIPIFKYGIFQRKSILDKIKQLLPSIPYCIKEACSCDENQNFKMLMMANRYIDYPDSFYEEVLKKHDLFEMLYPPDTGLPRNYSDLPLYYSWLPLPKTEAVKRKMVENPISLFRFKEFPDIPFTDADILQRLFEHERSGELIEQICASSRGICAFRSLAQIKGDAVLFNYILGLSESELQRLLDEFVQSSDEVIDNAFEEVKQCSLDRLLMISDRLS